MFEDKQCSNADDLIEFSCVVTGTVWATDSAAAGTGGAVLQLLLFVGSRWLRPPTAATLALWTGEIRRIEDLGINGV